jgi:hypothetical protein
MLAELRSHEGVIERAAGDAPVVALSFFLRVDNSAHCLGDGSNLVAAAPASHKEHLSYMTPLQQC